MKEITETFKDTAVEIHEEKQHKKEIKLIGQQRKVRGLTLWEFNQTTKELKPATFKKEVITLQSLSDKITLHQKVVVNENCIYFQALNKANAKRKLGI